MDEISPNPMPVQQAEPMKKNHTPLWIALAIIVALAAGYGAWRWYAAQKGGQRIDANTNRVNAPAGSVIQNFPQELLLEKNVVVSQSYSMNYASQKLEQPVVQYVSAWSMAGNVKAYREYLLGNGWALFHMADPSLAVTNFYGTKGKATVNITFVKDMGTGKVTVTIAYALQQ